MALKNNQINSVLVTASLFLAVSGFPHGGPASICNDPYPHHGRMQSTELPPYRLSLNQSMYEPGDIIQVRIRGNEAVMTGVQLAAHSTTGAWEMLYGEFVQFPDSIIPYQYYSASNNCLTHSDALAGGVSEVSVLWKAPAVSTGDLLFSATVVKQFDTFWVNISALLTASQPAIGGVIKLPKLQQTPGYFDPDLNLDECTVKSGCLVYPYGCSGETCRFSASYKMVENGSGVRFRLTNKHAVRSRSYIALGISRDTWMDKDETFTCLDIGGSLEFGQGYNPSWYNIKVRSDTVRNIAIQSVDGVITCEFTRNITGRIEYIGFQGTEKKLIDYRGSVDSPMYHLYLSWGVPYAGAKETAKKHVELPIVSRSPVAFASKQKGSFYQLHDTVKVHVSFMVVAWFGAAAITMIVSRYFKAGFMNAKDKLCGLKPWFQVHRSLAFAAALLTAVAFIIIFVHFMKLSEHQILHAGFGIAVMILVVGQIVIGLLRPGPHAGRKRTAFNWGHRIFGTVMYILAAVTIFLGSKMSYMSEVMQTTGVGLLAGLIAVHLLTAILMEVLGCCFKQDEANGANGRTHCEGNSNQMTIQEAPTGDEESDRKYVVQFCLFGLYVCITLSLIVCFLAVLWIY